MNIFDFTEKGLEEYLIQNNFKKYNSSQVLDWIYKKHIYSFNEMTNLSKELMAFLNDKFEISLLELVEKEESKDVGKYLLRLLDGLTIECVLMHQKYGTSLCISSQVGCNMNCGFCESGVEKKLRDLSCGEMISQILTVQNIESIRIDSVVVMGIGEPFDNFHNTKDFIKIATNPKMLELGARKITVSTCGLVPKIKEFALLDTQVNLAISLHAPFDNIRREIMPIAKAYSVKEVMESLDFYIEKTNRKVTLEYVMLNNINDTVDCAKELSRLLKGKLVYVNLIPFNETSKKLYKRSENFKIMKFYDILKRSNIEVTVRKEFGGNISAACGQLRSKRGV